MIPVGEATDCVPVEELATVGEAFDETLEEVRNDDPKEDMVDRRLDDDPVSAGGDTC